MPRLWGIVGQDQAASTLEAQLASAKVGHAYLFTGPEGTGRGTMARALFMALNCQDPAPDQSPCGSCIHCTKALGWKHEDLVVLAPASSGPSAQIKVEQIREVIRLCSIKPFSAHTRIVLIREAHHMNPQAAGALLKTLEEPPPGNILVLTSSDPGRLLPTITSRCQTIAFSPLPTKLIEAELLARGVEPAEARTRAALAAGSLGRALEIDPTQLAQDLEWVVSAVCGVLDLGEAWAVAEKLVERFRSKGGLDRQGLARVLELAGVYFRDLAAGPVGGQQLVAGLIKSPPMKPKQALEAFFVLEETRASILENINPVPLLALAVHRLNKPAE